MTYKEYLISGLSDITCCFGGCNNYYWSMSAFHLLMFALGSFAMIFILSFIYNKIPKSNSSINELSNPIYQSKDILLQSKSNDVSFVFAEKKTSTFVKFFAFVLITIVVFTPLQEFLGL